MPFNIKIVQNAYVVESLDDACAELHRTFGMGPFLVVRDFRMGNHTYRGNKADDIVVDAAVTQSGDLQIELVQMKSKGPDAISDMYKPGSGMILHHVAHICENNDYEEIKDLLAASGAPLASEFAIDGGGKVCFMDTRSTLGHMVELYEDSVWENELYRIVREKTANWDGQQLFVDW
jgi:hypothetical protein